ncbi:MAG: asparaginase [Crocinitomicaceae bacterium]|nr:asparaginase [Crocinitomicaceae bacterium]
MKKSAVLLIYTGGTIGMIKDPETDRLKAIDFELIYDHVPELKRFETEITCISTDEPIDSSEMLPSNWVDLSELIKEHYSTYDGFVILHGSDTMAYTASALSFLIQGTQKPIILTGSQLPIGTIRTDGRENLITAIEIASAKDKFNRSIVQEVAVYFEYSLYRGNRCSKISANQFEAFQSPNFPQLAVAGVNIAYNNEYLHRSSLQNPIFSNKLHSKIGLFKIYPGIPMESYKELFNIERLSAIVIETFGSGNAPANKTFQECLKKYIGEGGIVVNITQCNSGFVQQSAYATSAFLKKIGVISGRDLTTEAAVTKLMYLFDNLENKKEIIQLLKIDLCGEMTMIKNKE